MSDVTADMIKTLRQRSGVGMSKCKEALVKASGDMETAIDILRKEGTASAVKKSGRETKEGLIGFAESEGAFALVEVSAETDFVIQNERFKEFLKNLSQEVLETAPASLESFLEQKYSGNPSSSVDAYRAEMVQTLGENMRIKRITYEKKSSTSSCGIYSHMGGKIVCVVVLEGDNAHRGEARDIAMHVASESPEYLDKDQVPQDLIEREEEIAREQIKGKPPQIIDKILIGKMTSFYDQICLLRQKFIKDSSISVSQYVESVGKKASKPLKLTHFIRWQMGQ